MDAAHTCKRESKALLERDVLSSSLPTILLLIPSFNLFGSSHGPLTAADLFHDVRKKLTRSLVAALTTNSTICHDLYIARASKTDKCVFDGENERKCLCSKSADTDPSPLFHLTKGLHPDFFHKSNPKKPVLPVWSPLPFLNEPHAPARGHLRELEGSQSSRGHHADICHSDRDR